MCRFDAAAREPIAKLGVGEHAPHRSDDGVCRTERQRLAVLEELATPQRSDTITGVPAAAASAATIPKLSPADARTNTSACG